jgi:predicted SPOUT superfamily RNA methylase MTH1
MPPGGSAYVSIEPKALKSGGSAPIEVLTLLGRKVAVAIPDTVLEEHDSLREKTTKLGFIARACAIYGVDLVEVFGDPRGGGESKRIKKVLEYLETPQYLRKRLYPLDEDLRYAGLLPPLRTPSHKARVPLQNLEAGDVREGVTNTDGSVDLGLDRPALLQGKTRANLRVTARITSKSPLRVELVSRDAVKEYWGYLVETKTLDGTLNDERFPLKIATSRLGDPLLAGVPILRSAVAQAREVMLLFGSPSRGLFDMAGPGLRERVDFVVNLFPQQQVQTVRTEEAVFAALSLLSFLS